MPSRPVFAFRTKINLERVVKVGDSGSVKSFVTGSYGTISASSSHDTPKFMAERAEKSAERREIRWVLAWTFWTSTDMGTCTKGTADDNTVGKDAASVAPRSCSSSDTTATVATKQTDRWVIEGSVAGTGGLV